MSRCIRHEPCPKCGSRDNVAVYEDGGKYCFGCGYTKCSQEWLEANGLLVYNYLEDDKIRMGMEFNKDVLEEIKQEYEYIDEAYRGIRPETYKYFGVMHKRDENGNLREQIYPTFRGKQICGFKRRGLPKEFLTPYGDVGADVDFFGQFRFLSSRSREVLIVGGEIDQLSAFQMMKDYRDRTNKVKGTDYPYIPIVSSTVGENGTFKQCRNQYEWLNRFEKIVVCMDNDHAGHLAVDQIFSSVPKEKLFVMDLEMKDPNEYLQAKKESQFIDCFYRAHPYVPVGVKGSGSLVEAVREHAMIKKIPLPPFMHKVQKMMAGGIPLGVIVNLISASGTGKSTLVDEIVYHWIFNSPYKVGVLSLESDAGEYGTKLLSRHVGRKINLIESIEEKIAFLDTDFVKKKEHDLFFDENGQDRFVLLDDRDGTVEAIQDTVEKMVVQLGCRVIVTDPLQDVIAALPDDEQNRFMSWEKGMVKSHDCTFLNVNHTKKALTGGGAGSLGVDLVEEDSHGSSSIYKSAACNLLFGRNKEAEDPVVRNTTHMKASKMRWTGNTSPFAGKYYYDNATHTMHDYDDYMRNHPELNNF